MAALFINKSDDKPPPTPAQPVSVGPGLSVEGSYNVDLNNFRVLSPPLTAESRQILSSLRELPEQPQDLAERIGGVVAGVDTDDKLGTPVRLLLTAGGAGEVLITGIRSHILGQRDVPDGAYLQVTPQGGQNPIPDLDLDLDGADSNLAEEDGRTYPADEQLTLEPGQQQYIDVWAHSEDGAYSWTAEVGYRQQGVTRWVPVASGLTTFETVADAPAYQQTYQWGSAATGGFGRVR